MADRLSLASAQALLNSMQESIRLAQELLRTNSAASDPTGPVTSTAARLVPRWHFPMINDDQRNRALGAALDQAIPPDAHVLDIGSGTGLLAMMAARAGAAHVTSCEQNPILAELAAQVIAKHGFSDVVTVVPKASTDLVVGVDLPRPVDLIVFEIVDCGLIGEGVLGTIRHAREHLLAPGGKLLPNSARLLGALLDSSAVDGLNRVRSAAGFDVGLLNTVSTRGHFPVRLATWPHQLLSEPTELCAFDFAGGPLDDGDADVSFTVTRSGVAHGVVAWFEMSLAGSVVLRNSANNAESHWMQAFLPFAEPILLARGETTVATVRWQRDRLSIAQPDNVA